MRAPMAEDIVWRVHMQRCPWTHVINVKPYYTHLHHTSVQCPLYHFSGYSLEWTPTASRDVASTTRCNSMLKYMHLLLLSLLLVNSWLKLSCLILNENTNHLHWTLFSSWHRPLMTTLKQPHNFTPRRHKPTTARHGIRFGECKTEDNSHVNYPKWLLEPHAYENI